jgi:hypothetical protein
MEMTSTQLTGMFDLGSVHTPADWNNYFRDVCAIYLIETSNEKVGGVGMTVEIDETKIFKNKNHTGRLTHEQQKGEWLFGGVCRETNETFFTLVQDRSEDTLLRILQDNVHQGTHIISDCWRGYYNVRLNGYTHTMVNHSQNFLDPSDPSTNTQKIERTWRTLKDNIPKGSRYEARMGYIIQYNFKKRVGWYDMSSGKRFSLMLGLIARYY